jgi:hypothetical protein
MTTSARLLGAAKDLAKGKESKGRAGWPRAAAFLARQALEASLIDLWSRRSPGLAGCPTRIQLICLSAAGLEADVAQQVRHTWAALSTACHHHPFEVGPSSQELNQWIGVATRLSEAVESQG